MIYCHCNTLKGDRRMKIKNEVLVIPGAPIEGVSPLPKFRSRKPAEHKRNPDFKNGVRESLCTSRRYNSAESAGASYV